MGESADLNTLTLLHGASIAFRRSPGTAPDLPGVVFCGGFRSNMSGGKAVYLEAECRRRGQGSNFLHNPVRVKRLEPGLVRIDIGGQHFLAAAPIGS